MREEEQYGKIEREGRQTAVNLSLQDAHQTEVARSVLSLEMMYWRVDNGAYLTATNQRDLD